MMNFLNDLYEGRRLFKREFREVYLRYEMLFIILQLTRVEYSLLIASK